MKYLLPHEQLLALDPILREAIATGGHTRKRQSAVRKVMRALTGLLANQAKAEYLGICTDRNGHLYIYMETEEPQ